MRNLIDVPHISQAPNPLGVGTYSIVKKYVKTIGSIRQKLTIVGPVILLSLSRYSNGPLYDFITGTDVINNLDFGQTVYAVRCCSTNGRTNR